MTTKRMSMDYSTLIDEQIQSEQQKLAAEIAILARDYVRAGGAPKDLIRVIIDL